MDREMRRRYGEALYEKIGMNPGEEQYHLFSVDIESAALVTIDQETGLAHQVWHAQAPANEGSD